MLNNSGKDCETVDPTRQDLRLFYSYLFFNMCKMRLVLSESAERSKTTPTQKSQELLS